MAAKILVVDDDVNICELLELYLNNAGYETRTCQTAASAMQILDENETDLVLLDVMLPDGRGFDVCRAIWKKTDIPVVMVTARDMLHDKIQGFNAGADDYIVKPFEPAEVVARVNARLRKPAVKEDRKSETVQIGNISVDLKSYEVKKSGCVVDLKPKEVQLLYFLITNKNIVFSRDTLLQKVWNYDFSGDTRTVDVHIKALRQKLEEGESSWSIRTVWGVGYKLEVK